VLKWWFFWFGVGVVAYLGFALWFLREARRAEKGE